MEAYMRPSAVSWDKACGSISNPASMLSAGNDETVMEILTAGQSPSVVLDFGRKTTGYLRLMMGKNTGDAILIEYGPLLASLHVRKIIRMPAEGTVWVDDAYIACRFMRISLLSDAQQQNTIQMAIRELAFVFSAYPCIQKGAFSTNDGLLDRIWETGAYTVQLCVQKHTESSSFNFSHLPEVNQRFIREWKSRYSSYVIFDGPRRDRETWLGDIRTEALALYGAFGLDSVVKSSLEVFLDLQRTDGTTVGSGGTRQEFKEYNLWWIIAIWECYLHTGDMDFLRLFHPGVEQLLGWILNAMDERGFIFNDNNWMWTLPREGTSSATQCILVETLRCSAKIMEAMGDPVSAVRLTARADLVREAVRRTFWNEEKGIFVDRLMLEETEIPVMSDVNCYAVTFGIAEAEQTRRILAYLRERMWTPYGSATLDQRIEKAVLSPEVRHYGLMNFVRHDPHPEVKIVEYMYPHNRMIWPFMNAYEVEARFLAGDADGAFELIRRCWGNMLEGGTGTFWECVDADSGGFPMKSFLPGSKMDCINSAAHGWSGWVSWILQTYVLGIRALQPGFRRTSVSPNPGSLREVRGVMPTPMGAVSVSIHAGENLLTIDVIHPEGMEIVVDVSPKVLGNRQIQTHLQIGK